MGTPWVPLRCPRCGNALAVPPPPTVAAGWVICPSCGVTFPVLAPRDPPPLFSWEAYPNLYPALPPPRRAGPAMRRLTVGTLLATTVLLLGLAGFLLWGGAAALGPGHFTLSGTVAGSTGAAIPGATVSLRSEAGYNETVLADATGGFRFAGIPTGAAVLNVSAPGFQTVNVDLLFSPTYTATGAGPDGQVAVTLQHGPANPPSQVLVSPFANLETLVASLFSATVLLALAGAVAVAGTVSARQGRRPIVATAASAGAIAAPVALVLLGATAVFPLLDWVITAATALGLVAFVLTASAMAWVGRPPDPY